MPPHDDDQPAPRDKRMSQYTPSRSASIVERAKSRYFPSVPIEENEGTETREPRFPHWRTHLFLVAQGCLYGGIVLAWGSIFSGLRTDTLDYSSAISQTFFLLPHLRALWWILLVLRCFGFLGFKMIVPVVCFRLAVLVAQLVITYGLGWHLLDSTPAVAAIADVLTPFVIYFHSRPLSDNRYHMFTWAYTVSAITFSFYIIEILVNVVFGLMVQYIRDPISVTLLLILQRGLFYVVLSYGTHLAKIAISYTGGVHQSHGLLSMLDSMSVTVSRVLVASVSLVDNVVLITLFTSITEIFSRGLFLRIRFWIARTFPFFAGLAKADEVDADFRLQQRYLSAHHSRDTFIMDVGAIISLPILLIVWSSHCPSLSFAESCRSSSNPGQLMTNSIIMALGKIITEFISQWLERREGVFIVTAVQEDRWSTFPMISVAGIYCVSSVVYLSYVTTPLRVKQSQPAVSQEFLSIAFVLGLLASIISTALFYSKHRKLSHDPKTSKEEMSNVAP